MKATWLADVLRNAGLSVEERPNWKTRGGELTAVKGVIVHHTAGPKSGNAPSLDWIERGHPHAPLSQLVLGRDGTFYVVAAGRSAHAGNGVWQGITDGNRNFIGIEVENAGDGKDPWPDVQLYALSIGLAAITKHAGVDEVMVIGHKEWAKPKGRKIDPALDMLELREAVASLGDLAAGNAVPAIKPRPEAPARAMLRKGDSGPSVKELQQLLAITADSQFGPKTEAAVKEFQTRKGLTADGLVGPKTWEALGRK